MKIQSILFLSLLSVMGASAPVFAHGTNVQYRKMQAVEIHAAFEGGQPMAEAQVIVYAPNEPTTPWKQSTTDSEGYFVFSPDPSQPGNWEVMIRQAGHGDVVIIPVEEEGQATAVESSAEQTYTPVQKALFSAAGVWGFLGTALFFARRKTT